jgi:hypothetical protein
MVACAGVGELSDAEDGLFGNPDVGRPGEGTVVLGRPIKFGLGDVKAKRMETEREITGQSRVVRLKLKVFLPVSLAQNQGLRSKDPLKINMVNRSILPG